MQFLLNISGRDVANQGLILNELRKYGYTQGKVVTTAESLHKLQKAAEALKCEVIILLHEESLKLTYGTNATLSDWRGSVLQGPIPAIVIAPLFHIWATKVGKFLFESDLRKVAALRLPKVKYEYEVIEARGKLGYIYEALKDAVCLVIDIETTRDNKIDYIAFTPIMSDNSIACTYALQLFSDAPEGHKLVRKLCDLPMPKCFHNGAFDTFQLLRFRIPCRNVLFDTEYMWWCWHVEMKKSLSFISSVLLHDFFFWKDQIEEARGTYNAKDTINTARVLLKLFEQMPDWAWQNYAKVQPLIVPIVSMGFEGLRVDKAKHAKAEKRDKEVRDSALASLQTMAGCKFNPASPKQVAIILYDIFDAKLPPRTKDRSTAEVTLLKLKRQSAILDRFISKLLEYREKAKAVSTYYGAVLHKDYLYYSIALDGTETGRFASSKSPLWAPLPEGSKAKSKQKNYGAQVQNIPYYFKFCLQADSPSQELIEIDKSQSEARCTAYLAQDEILRAALEDPPTKEQIRQYMDGLAGRGLEYKDIEAAAGDFYCRCAYLFFGLIIHKGDPVRQITKKIIHGTNYMMKGYTFIDSVGYEGMQSAKELLNVAPSVRLKKFADYLLTLYHKAYPEVAKLWEVTKLEAATKGYVITPDGWRREVLGNPVKDHQVWRALVAHRPQHFSVAGINRALWRIFYEVQIPSKGAFRIKAQVHDSLLFINQKHKGDTYVSRALEIMGEPQQTDMGPLSIPLDMDRGDYWKS